MKTLLEYLTEANQTTKQKIIAELQQKGVSPETIAIIDGIDDRMFVSQEGVLSQFSQYPDFVSVVEVDMTMRGSSPSAVTKTFVELQPAVYTKAAFDKKMEEWKEDPVDKWIKNLMLEYKFTEEDEKKGDKEPKTFVEEILKSVQDNYGKKGGDKDKKRFQIRWLAKTEGYVSSAKVCGS